MSENNFIKKHFAGLGYTVHLNKFDKSRPGVYTLEYKDGPDAGRMVSLAQYYFGEIEPKGYGGCDVRLEDFNEEGHGMTGICKKCGCTYYDACEDPDTGTCYWLEEDLCSACGSPEQRATAMCEMELLFKDQGDE